LPTHVTRSRRWQRYQRAAALAVTTQRKEVQRVKKISVRKAGAIKLTGGAALYIGWHC
jgi:hypothetical protein